MLTTDNLNTTYDIPARDKFADNCIKSIITGKGTTADNYMNAGYKAKTRKVAKANGCRLKKHPEVKQKIESFKKELDKQIQPATVVTQLKTAIDSTDIRSSLGGIQEYNRLKGNYADAKLRLGQIDQTLEDLRE